MQAQTPAKKKGREAEITTAGEFTARFTPQTVRKSKQTKEMLSATKKLKFLDYTTPQANNAEEIRVTTAVKKKYPEYQLPLSTEEQKRILTDRPSQKINQQLKTGKTVHLGLIDERDVDLAASLIDYPDKDSQGNHFEDRQKIAEMYIKDAHAMQDELEIRNRYPNAQFSLKHGSMMAQHMDASKKLHARGKNKAAYSRKNTLIQLAKERNHKAAEFKTRIMMIEATRSDEQEQVEAATARAARRLMESEKAALSIATIVNNPTSSIKEKRQNISEFKFIPKNANSSAITLLASQILKSQNDKIDDVQFSCLDTYQVQELAKSRGFDSVEAMMEDIREGMKMKQIRKVHIIGSGDDQEQSEDAIEDLDDYYEDKDERDMLHDSDLDQEEIDIEDPDYAEDDLDADQELDMEKEFQGVLQGDAHFTVPFKFSKRFIYKVVYYIALNEFGIIFPFGRTIPDLPWIYVHDSYYDPYDIYQLRYNKDSYMLKIGGLGLIEKSRFFENNFDARLKSCYTNTMTLGTNMRSFKNVIVAVMTGVFRLQEKRKSYSGTCDLHNDLLIDIEELIIKAETTARSSGLDDMEVVKDLMGKVATLKSKLDRIDEGEAVYRDLIKQFFDISYKRDMPTIHDIYRVISYSVIKMGELIWRKALEITAGDEDALKWMVRMMVATDGHHGDLDFETVMKQVDDKNDDTLLVIYQTPKQVKEVKKAFEAAKSKMNSLGTPQQIGLFISSAFIGDEIGPLSDATIEAELMIARNRQAASIIKSAVEKQIENRIMAAEPKLRTQQEFLYTILHECKNNFKLVSKII